MLRYPDAGRMAVQVARLSRVIGEEKVALAAAAQALEATRAGGDGGTATRTAAAAAATAMGSAARYRARVQIRWWALAIITGNVHSKWWLP